MHDTCAPFGGNGARKIHVAIERKHEADGNKSVTRVRKGVTAGDRGFWRRFAVLNFAKELSS